MANTVKIGLDCGHGLHTAGKQTPDGIKEWTLNNGVRKHVINFLKDYDVEFVFTDGNEGKTDESLASRKAMYIREDVDVFVSIHHNAYTGTWNNATGVETYTDRTYTKEDQRLAECIHKKLVKYTGMKDRGIKRANWAVINQNQIPAVLTEGGFMDNLNDYKYIITDEGQKAYGRAVAEGLIEFLNLKKKTTSTPTSTTTSTPTSSAALSHKAGEIVNFKGTKHYTSADGNASSTCKPGEAKITAVSKNAKHPYHLVRVDEKGSTVYGWVDADDIEKIETNTTTPFMVRIIVDDLNIRAGAGTNYKVVGCITDKGSYTIVKTSGSWGYLKSGAGWINISSKYAKRI